MIPPPDVLRAFRTDGPPVPLAGGRGTAWRCGDVVLKPLDTSPDAMEWMGRTLRSLPGSDLRLSLPLQSDDGRVVVRGWTAFPFLPGQPPRDDWDGTAATARSFARLLMNLPRPAFTRHRVDPWARADRYAWREETLDVGPPWSLTTGSLLNAWAPVESRDTLVHGDIAGNILVAPGLPPAVIDLTLYWRPVEYSVAILTVDATCFEGAPLTLLETIDPHPEFAQFLLRALLFRIVTDAVVGVDNSGRYEPTVAHVLDRLRY